MKYPSLSLCRAFLLSGLVCLPLLGARGQTTGIWTNADDRDYVDGNGMVVAFWSWGYVPPPNGHVGNWSGVPYPGSGGVTDAILDAPGNTLCDVQVSIDSLTIKPGGALNMDQNSALTVTTTNFQADGTMTAGGYAGGAFPVFTNAGTLTKSAGTGTFTFDPIITFNSLPGSAIKVTSGTLVLPGDSFNGTAGTLDTVSFAPFAGATIVLMNTDTTGTPSEHAQGTLSGSTGTVLLEGGVLQGGQSPCTLNFTGKVFQWTGGTIGAYQQGANFTNTGTINIAGTDAKETDATFTNRGTIIQSSSVGLNIGDYNSGGSMTNAAGATYDMQTNAGIGQSGYPFHNIGLLKKSGGTGVSTLTCGFFNEGGTVEVDSGTLQLPLNLGNGLSTGGTFNVTGANALLDLGDGQHFTGTYRGSGAGHVRFSQGALFTDNQTGATFNFPGALFQWTGGTIGASQGGHLFTNAGTMNLSGANDKTTYANPFTNKGTMILTGTGNFNVGGGSSGGSFNNALGATFNLAGGASIGGTFDSMSNAGLFEKTAGSGTSTIDLTVTNTGSLLVNSGTLAITHFTQNSGLLDLNGGNFSSPNDIVINGGIVEGNGTITGNLVNNGGIVAPGHSPGKITVTGDYTQGADAEIDMQIAGAVSGTGYDKFIVKGAANLGGTLKISLLNGFKPTVGDVYTLVSAGSFNGTFSKVTINGFTGKIDTSTNGVTLTITSNTRQLLNIATRLNVLTGNNVLIGGFIISGSQPKKVLIEAIGPSLTKYGVMGALADPVLELHKPDGSVVTNDNWKQTQEAAIQATGLAPSDPSESAILATLAPGAYTAIVRGNNNGTGVAIIQAYDRTPTVGELGNIATRGFVDSGENVMIGGFIIGGGTAGTSATVLIRGIGPSLAKAGITGALQDPTLELHDANGNVLKTNDNWKTTQEAAIKATGLAPSDDRESAILDTLAPGSYTAILRGKNNTTGVGLVEVYDVAVQ